MTHDTCANVLQSSLDRVRRKAFKENQWGARHVTAWMRTPNVGLMSCAQSVVSLIQAAAAYADAHARAYGGPIGDDYVLGAYWVEILGNIRGMLNGELGHLDGGTLDRLLMDLATSQNTELDA